MIDRDSLLSIDCMEFLVEAFLEEKNIDIHKIIDILENYYDVSKEEIIEVIKETKYSILLEEDLSEKMKTLLTYSAINKMIHYLVKKNPEENILVLIQELDSLLSYNSGKDASVYILNAIRRALKDKGQYFSFYFNQFKKLRPVSCKTYLMEMMDRDFCK